MDFAGAAEAITDVAERVLERVGVEPGMELLDVPCGTGNAAIPAAGAAARVTGLDPSADLLAIARERAADAMIEVDWVEGDPRELPFPAGRFDRVISVFGMLDDRIASELRRVCRGRIGVCRWTPDSVLGEMLGMVADASSGEEQIRAAFGDGMVERGEIEMHEESAGRFADFMLESVGRRDRELRERFVRTLEAANLADDGTLRFRGEYLVSVVDV
jgi:SAM-dependent methyltransferase